METSTPINSHRRSIFPATTGGEPRGELTPLRLGRQTTRVQFELDASNDDIERTDRRKSIALRISLSNIPPASSPSLDESGRRLSDHEIKSHLQICTKLHAENKINVKNAWSLNIIDVLKQLVTRNHPDVLKIAGNSLEIAGKVYGLRVDDLHAEGLRLAASLARNFKKRPRDDDENEENIDSQAPPEENQQKKKKKQKKRRTLLSGDKKHTVNHDPKSWKGTIPKLESATFSVRTDTTVGAVENLFTNNVKMDPAGYKFMFLSKERAWSWTPGNDLSVKEDTNKKFPIKIKPINRFTLCAPFKDFKLDEWDPDMEKDELGKMSDRFQKLDDVVFDDNGIPIPELDGSVHDVFQDRDFSDCSNEDEPMEEEVIVPHINQGLEHIVDFRPTEEGLAKGGERSDYSYNTVISTASGKIDQIWAGPSHWKLKFIRNKKLVYTGQDQQEQAKKTKSVKKKDKAKPIDITQLKPLIDFAAAPTVHSKKTKKRFTVDDFKITLPLFDSSWDQLLKNIYCLMTIPTMKPSRPKPRPDIDYEVTGYKYDNPNDSRYIPQNMSHEDGDNGADLGNDHIDDEFMGDRIADTPESQENFGGHLTGANLIDAPQMVPQSYLSYATRAKKMNMKKLKQAVWCTLCDSEEYDESAQVIPTTFSEMYKTVPKRLPEKMSQEMSCPLAFVALLHLCNEHSLILKQDSEYKDFQILGPK